MTFAAKIIDGLFKTILVLISFSLVAILLALPTMWLWNYAAVDVLSVHRLDFWHALALNLLCGMLFKSNSSSK